jgi:hypothetical protein
MSVDKPLNINDQLADICVSVEMHQLYDVLQRPQSNKDGGQRSIRVRAISQDLHHTRSKRKSSTRNAFVS